MDNDSDPDGDVITLVQRISDPENGIVTDNEDGSFTYTPNQDFLGRDCFDYQITDGELTDVASICITIKDSDPGEPGDDNQPPVAQDDEYTTDKNTPIDITDYMDNDSDPDGDVITLVQRISDPENGIVTDNEDGSFTYTPNQDFVGRDCFDYQITDGELTDVASICITIKDSDPGEPGDDNQPPVAKDDRYSTQKNRTLTVDPPGILVNDSDPDGDSIIVDVDTVSEPNHGTLTQKEDGSFIYTPDTNYTGTDTYTYRVFDGELYSEFATVTITIRPRSSGGGSSRDRDTDPRDTTPTPVDPDEPDEEDPPVIIPEPQPEPVPPVTPEPDPTPAPAPKPTSMPDPTPVSQAPPIRELPKTGANPLPMAGLGTLLVGLGFYIKRTSKNES
jgi:LPXTG-motif cell wall-anchored protein